MVDSWTLRSARVGLVCVGVAASVANAQSHYAEVDLSGITIGRLYEMAMGFGGGMAIADFDDDGDLDLFLPNREGLADRLIENLGDGRFGLVASFDGTSGDPLESGRYKPRSRVGLFIDYDGDRRLDLFIAGDCFDCDTNDPVPTVPSVLAASSQALWATPRLHRQFSDGTFEDVTDLVGLGSVRFLSDCESAGQSCAMAINEDFPPGPAFMFQHLGGLAAGDFNDDGLPDIFVGHWFAINDQVTRPKNARLFLSDPATGGFIDDATMLPAAANSNWQGVVCDFNDDGALDLFGAVDVGLDRLWVKDGNAFTEDSASAGINRGVGSPDMGIGIGDFDNDGAFDLYLTATNTLNHPMNDAFFFKRPSEGRYGPLYPVRHEDMNKFPNDMTRSFVESGKSWGWGVTALDADLDGDEDLAITNGFSNVPAMAKALGRDNAWFSQNMDRSLLLINELNLGNGFVQMLDGQGDDAWAFDVDEWGSALGAFDLDRDGDLDLAQTVQRTWEDDPKVSEFRLLENDFNDDGSHFWLTVRPRLTTRNTRSIGAIVRATPAMAPGRGRHVTQSRLISAGESYMSQEPYEAHFGFGDIQPSSVTITIEWPDGTPDSVFVLRGSELNRVVTYGWCDMVDLAAPYGQLDMADFWAFRELFEAGDARADLIAPVGVGSEDIFEAIDRIGAGCPADSIFAPDLP